MLLAGQGVLFGDFSKIAEEDLKKGESIGIAIALIVLIVVFAAIVAALLPVVMALVAIGIALGAVALIGQIVDFNLFVTNMVTMIGLAVGIDYSLFIVSRYREERKKGFAKLDAIGASGATANRAVFFSGMTVVLALAGMFLIPTTIFRSLATGAILVTLAALAASMTLLPAILALLGDRINWPRLSKRARVDAGHDPRGGFWDKVTNGVMKRPVVFLVGSVVILGGLGSFYFQLHRGTSQNVSSLPNDFPSKAAFLTLERDFAGGQSNPVRIAITGDVHGAAATAAIAKLRNEIAGQQVFSPQTNLLQSPDGKVLEVDAFFRGDPNTDAAFQGVRDMRSTLVPEAFSGVNDVEVLVGGNPGRFTDFLDVIDKYQPLGDRRGAGAVVHPADGGVPHDRRPAHRDRDEPAVGGRRVRRADARVPEGRGDRVLQLARVPVPAGRGDRGVAAAVPVLGAVRAVDGLPGVPGHADPRASTTRPGTTTRRSRTGCGRPPGSSPAPR